MAISLVPGEVSRAGRCIRITSWKMIGTSPLRSQDNSNTVLNLALICCQMIGCCTAESNLPLTEHSLPPVTDQQILQRSVFKVRQKAQRGRCQTCLGCGGCLTSAWGVNPSASRAGFATNGNTIPARKQMKFYMELRNKTISLRSRVLHFGTV